MSVTRKRPIRTRTCIATRDVLPDTELLRLVQDPDAPGRILADPRRSLPGRGAWITPTREAVELAEQRRAFGRAFRLSAPADLGHVHTYLANLANDPTQVRKTEH
ncbi:DNA-binding protein [Corynebacterium hadale]|uniref:DNA-binding protein n=1 Tax=Corynebacterium hadale TaxID=2026255 RepID=A0AB36RJA7_9CORY|nr:MULTISPECIES: YlxR family protein [Corynebacterium]MCG7253585.1 YlxR family protein [Corynebacterium hadale]MCG7256024.1 YlxR family protein [Corynebacterium hadale]MCG7264225.1 YlxR family protein [Corynebacterium hadale]PAT02976.1 DNA-binding protein [Corynebacterium sp. NML 150383]PAT07132.1 DNA-binding protein [Corynebacterium hadale]